MSVVLVPCSAVLPKQKEHNSRKLNSPIQKHGRTNKYNPQTVFPLDQACPMPKRVQTANADLHAQADQHLANKCSALPQSPALRVCVCFLFLFSSMLIPLFTLVYYTRSPVVPFYPFLGEGSPTKIDYRKKGTLIPTSLLEDLV